MIQEFKINKTEKKSLWETTKCSNAFFLLLCWVFVYRRSCACAIVYRQSQTKRCEAAGKLMKVGILPSDRFSYSHSHVYTGARVSRFGWLYACTPAVYRPPFILGVWSVCTDDQRIVPHRALCVCMYTRISYYCIDYMNCAMVVCSRKQLQSKATGTHAIISVQTVRGPCRWRHHSIINQRNWSICWKKC